jgi:pre-mRNA-splicing factor SPF27
LEPPNRTFPSSDEERPEFIQQWRETLRRAYASSTYLSGRNTSLALLETYGKNAWLVGNWQLETELKALETELAEAKKEAELLKDERRPRQEAVAAEMMVLQESWKKGISGLVEVQVATEQLRRDILDKRMEMSGT